MIETEKSKKISDADLVTDIENTKIEVQAYRKLASGYQMLSDLPETSEASKKMYSFRAQANSILADDCQKLLDKLIGLFKERRGIE